MTTLTDVRLTQLCKTYPGAARPVVMDLSLSLTPGKITALLGPSGCGKTTVMKMIAGLIAPSAGDILFDGQSVLPLPAEARSAVMVFQNHLLFPYMSVAENIGFGLKMRGIGAAEIAPRVADMLDPRASARPWQPPPGAAFGRATTAGGPCPRPDRAAQTAVAGRAAVKP